MAKRYDQISAFILSGGLSSRMGKDKGLLELGGKPLIVRTAHLLEPLVSAVMVVGTPERYAPLGLHAIADWNFDVHDRKGAAQGPLVGIATALHSTKTGWNLILACDLPYLSAEWLEWVLARAMVSGQQIVMPRTSRGLETLAAVYRRECGPQMVASLARGVRKVSEAMEQFRLELVSESDWRHVDPDGRVLQNMNSSADYEDARKWWATK
jgi:molybdopterin-guanine dinucleotide biosynthesis protein A